MYHLPSPRVAGVLLVFLVACGGNAPPAQEPASPPSWSREASKDQKAAFMKHHIVPSMAPVFQAASATRYAEFGCKTCHGPKLEAPQQFLPRLVLKDGQLTAFTEKPEIAKFMAEAVVPKMAAAMGLPPFDAQTGQGFGCAGCHRIEHP